MLFLPVNRLRECCQRKCSLWYLTTLGESYHAVNHLCIVTHVWSLLCWAGTSLRNQVENLIQEKTIYHFLVLLQKRWHFAVLWCIIYEQQAPLPFWKITAAIILLQFSVNRNVLRKTGKDMVSVLCDIVCELHRCLIFCLFRYVPSQHSAWKVKLERALRFYFFLYHFHLP